MPHRMEQALAGRLNNACRHFEQALAGNLNGPLQAVWTSPGRQSEQRCIQFEHAGAWVYLHAWLSQLGIPTHHRPLLAGNLHRLAYVGA